MGIFVYLFVEGWGQLAFAVYEVYETKGIFSMNLQVAIKYIPVQSVPNNVQVKNDQIVPAEVYFLKKLKHQNIIKLLSHYEFENHHVLVMERPSDGISLYDYLGKRGGELSEQEVKKIARQLIPAVMYMEEMGVIHNDLKTENILLDESAGRVKIIDFGLACRLSCDPIDRFIGMLGLFKIGWKFQGFRSIILTERGDGNLGIRGNSLTP